MGLRPRGKLGPVLPAMPSCLPPSTAPSSQGPFPPATLFFVAIVGTTIPSDSRCTRRDFTVGLYAPLCPDLGRADGSLLFHTEPCVRAAPRTPAEPATGVTPDFPFADMAFTATCSARL